MAETKQRFLELIANVCPACVAARLILKRACGGNRAWARAHLAKCYKFGGKQAA